MNIAAKTEADRKALSFAMALSLACLAGTPLRLIPLSPALEPLVIGAAWAKDGVTSAAERFFQIARQAVLKSE